MKSFEAISGEGGKPLQLRQKIKRSVPELTLFLVVGGLNSLLTYAFYVLLLFFFKYSIAYTLSYISGIFISYYLNSEFVFREKPRLSKAMQYPVVYLGQYLAGIILLYLIIELAHISSLIAPILVVALTFPLTYSLSRSLIKGPT